MKFNNFIIPLIAAGMMASCSDDPSVTPENSNLDGLYMTLTVSPQSMTRTTTGVDDGNTEFGQEDENKVSKLLLVLVDSEDKIVDCARVSEPTSITTADNGVTATGQFDRQRMINYLTGTHSDTKFYVICNPTEAQSFNIGESINDFICSKIPTTYYTSNSFVMSNAQNIKVTLPTLDAVVAGNYNTPLTAYEIGNVPVERVAVRFDYTDHLENDEDFKGKKGADDSYYYILADAQKDGGALNVSIKQLALCNMGKAFYLFKRTSTDGMTNNVSMFGPETATNYVVDPYGKQKGELKANSGADAFDNYFYYALFGKNPNLEFKDVSAIMAQGNERGDANGATTGNRYNFWRYALPSTLPADPTQTQKNGNSTGVIFRAEITTPDESGALKTAMDNGNDLYAFGGKIIGNYKAIKKIVNEDPANEISVAFKNALNDKEEKSETATDEMEKKLVGVGFAIYRAENGKYFCDYYYWNRHNDNNRPLVMGAMEFGAVRNNIYKLVVTDISKLGHPTIKTDDPDPVDPDDPDETSDFYMKVKVTVKNWGVRVNKIKF